MDQLFRIKNLQEKLTAFDVLLALEKHTKLKGLAVEIEKISASRDSRILSAVPSVCAWKQEDQFDTRCYATSCDAMIAMTEGTPEENDYKFCPFCGKPIQVERGIAG